MKRWDWDFEAGIGYNILAKFESTLINLGVLEDYANIDVSEAFENRYWIGDSLVFEKYRKFSLVSNREK